LNGCIEKFDPCSGKSIAKIHQGTEEDAATLVDSARNEFFSWRKTPILERASILLKATQIMERNKNNIARIVHIETGKSMKDALGEVSGAIRMGYFWASEGERFYGRTMTSGMKDRFAYTVREPVGVCALITSFNTPIANTAWKMFPALLCGNTAVIKPSEYTPYTTIMFAEMLAEAGLPPGVFSVLQGDGQAGRALIEQDIDLVSFTGSARTGFAVRRIVSERPVKVSLELGGKNPLVVCADADIDWAVECALLSAFSNAGQRCAAGSRILVDVSIANVFKEKLVARTNVLRLGNADEDDLGPVVSEKQLMAMLTQCEDAKKRGRIAFLAGGYRVGRPGYFMAPTIIDDEFHTSLLAQNELFGPIVSIHVFDTFREMIEMVNGTPYGLTAAIHTKHSDAIQCFIRDCRSGIVSVNGPTYGSEPNMPFGGVGVSGNGFREPGTEALDVYTETKGVYIKYFPDTV